TRRRPAGVRQGAVMRAACRLAAVVALTGAVALPACRRQAARPAPATPPPRPALGPIAIENLSPPADRARGDERAIESDLRRRRGASGMFGAAAGGDAGGAATARPHVVLAGECVEVGAKGEARAQVRVRVDTRPSDAPGAVDFDVEAQGAEPYAVPA